MIQEKRFELPHGMGLNCRVAGTEGRPVLMFLHGFPEAAFVWDPLLAHFSQAAHGGYFCIAPHMRGFAGSSSPTEVAAYRAKHLVQDIAALKQQVSPDQALAALVAHDWGVRWLGTWPTNTPNGCTTWSSSTRPTPGLFCAS